MGRSRWEFGVYAQPLLTWRAGSLRLTVLALRCCQRCSPSTRLNVAKQEKTSR